MAGLAPARYPGLWGETAGLKFAAFELEVAGQVAAFEAAIQLDAAAEGGATISVGGGLF